MFPLSPWQRLKTLPFIFLAKEGVPNLIIANTIKGKGFSFSENNNNWHHAVMTKTLYEKAKKELENTNDN